MTARLQELCGDTPAARTSRNEVFNSMDPNGNNVLSLAEVQKFMAETWPEFDKQRMLIRAFNAADNDGSGLVARPEFFKLLKYILFFNDLYDKFVAIDSNDDHRLDEGEFVKGCELIAGSKIEDAAAAFKAMDQNGGGFVLFDEFSVWIARKMCVDESGADEETYADAYRGSLAAIKSADGTAVRSGAWWKGRAKLQAMTSKTDPKAQTDRRALYKRIDVDGSKGVSPKEVFTAVKTMWPEFDSMEAVTAAFHAADRTGDGTVQVEEFRLLLKYLLFYDQAWEHFKALNTNADGRLSQAEFVKGLHMLNLKKAVADPDAAFREMNADGGAGVELKEFAAWLAKHQGQDEDMIKDTEKAM